ncbi:MAG: hypothetical protein QM479_12415 [Pseudomonadota bacterium]
MNKLTTLLIASAAAISLNVNADPLMDIIHPESADIFNLERSSGPSTPVALYEYESVGPIVWSYEYEEWVNTQSSSLQNVSSVLNEIESNPPASGGRSIDTMSYLTETIDEEYQH